MWHVNTDFHPNISKYRNIFIKYLVVLYTVILHILHFYYVPPRTYSYKVVWNCPPSLVIDVWSEFTENLSLSWRKITWCWSGRPINCWFSSGVDKVFNHIFYLTFKSHLVVTKLWATVATLDLGYDISGFKSSSHNE